MKKYLAMFLTAVMSFSLLSGCSGTQSQQPEESDSSAVQREEAQSPSEAAETGGNNEYAEMIIIGEATDAKYMDPWQALGTSEIKYQNHIYENLLLNSFDGSEKVPCLATSWEISDDGLTYTFQLTPDLKFSNGDPVTEEDWQFSFYRARDHQESNALSRAEMIDTVSMPDDHTLVITITEPTPPFLDYLTSYNLVVASKKHFDAVGAEEFILSPMGTGPYYMKEWHMNEYMILEANPNYRYADQGLPVTKTVRYNIISDDNTRFVQLQGGMIDIAPNLPLTMMAQVAAQPDLKAESFSSTQMRHMIINTTIEPLSDIRVREALRYVTDKQEIADIVAHGYAELSASSVPSAHGKFLNRNIKDPDVDVEKAKALLADAGYADGLKITISVSSSQQVYTDIATVLKSQWAQAGIDLEIQSLESASLTDLFRSLSHQVTILQWTDSGGDPASLMGFICDYSESQNWYTGLGNEEIAELYQQSRTELDEEKRVALIHEIQEIVYDAHCIIPLFTTDYVYGVNESIQNLAVSNGGRINLSEIYKVQ